MKKLVLGLLVLLHASMALAGGGSSKDDGAKGVIGTLDEYVRSLESKALGSVKKALCYYADAENKPLATDILQSIDGVGIKGTFDASRLGELLTGGGRVTKWLAKLAGSNATVKMAVEIVYWFPPDKPGIVERHIHIIPQAGLGSAHPLRNTKISKAISMLDADVGIIFGCGGDAHKYGGYFGTVQYGGINLNLGLDFDPLIERAMLARLESTTPGGINDNKSVNHRSVLKVIKAKGRLMGAHVMKREIDERHPEKVYQFSYTDDAKRFEKIMKEVRFRYYDDYRKLISLDTVYKEAVKFAKSNFDWDGNKNTILEDFAVMKNMTIQKGEDLEFYKKVRLPYELGRFRSMVNKYYGRESVDEKQDLTKPEGINQKLFAYSGSFFGKVYNNKLYKVAFNTVPKGTDGPYLYSVGDDLHKNIRRTMLGNGPYSCKRQRERYPDTRWFIVYSGKSKMYFDCYGFGKDELYRSGISYRLYNQTNFNKIKKEMVKVKIFFENMEAARYMTRHGLIQLSDSVNTAKDVYSFETGGIRPSKSLAETFTGCNAIGMDPHGLVNLSSLGISAVKDGATSLLTRIKSGANLSKAMSHITGHSHLSVELAHYYHTPFHAHFHASKALPFIRSVRALKSMNCFEKGIPELDPANDHHHGDYGDGHHDDKHGPSHKKDDHH